MLVKIEGTYQLVKSDNFDEYLKSCGVNFFIRSFANKFKPTVEIFKDGDYWIFRTVTPLKTIEVRFKFGEEFETDFPDGSGRKLKSTATLEGNKIKQVQKLSDGTALSDIKEFTEDQMITVITHGNVTSVRTYKRVA